MTAITTRRRTMLAAVVLVALSAVAGCTRFQRTPETQVTAGSFALSLRPQPNPPRQGANSMRIAVRDAGGAPVHGARVSVRASMPSMGAMPYMESGAQVREESPGVFIASFGLAMGGDWDLALHIATARDSADVAAKISTHAPGVAVVSAEGADAAPAGAAPAAAPGAAPAGYVPVTLDPAREQEFGVRVASVAVRDLAQSVRAAGEVRWDESRQSDITLKVAGYVRHVRVDAPGRSVRQGEVLCTVYSPELLAAQQEWLDALHGARTNAMARELADAARRRLRLWDVPESVLRDIEKRGTALEELPVLAPRAGIIAEKRVVEGSAFEMGMPLFRLAGNDPVWVVANVYQRDLAGIAIGAPVALHDPQNAFSATGHVASLGATLDPSTHTIDLRISVANPRGTLHPGMYVDAEISSPRRPSLAVPAEAVIPAGASQIVFVATSRGRYAPRAVVLGPRDGAWYPVLSGVSAGETVVISGNFLVASESRLRGGAQQGGQR